MIEKCAFERNFARIEAAEHRVTDGASPSVGAFRERQKPE
jgi:hypothetical protein